MASSINRAILSELRVLARQRGQATKEQRYYLRLEERAMNEMYPIPKPSEEKRLSYLRTLDRYIGKDAAANLMETRRLVASNRITLSLN